MGRIALLAATFIAGVAATPPIELTVLARPVVVAVAVIVAGHVPLLISAHVCRTVAKRRIVIARACEVVVVPEIAAKAAFAILAPAIGAVAIPVFISVLSSLRRGVGLCVYESGRMREEQGDG